MDASAMAAITKRPQNGPLEQQDSLHGVGGQKSRTKARAGCALQGLPPCLSAHGFFCMRALLVPLPLLRPPIQLDQGPPV